LNEVRVNDKGCQNCLSHCQQYLPSPLPASIASREFVAITITHKSYSYTLATNLSNVLVVLADTALFLLLLLACATIMLLMSLLLLLPAVLTIIIVDCCSFCLSFYCGHTAVLHLLFVIAAHCNAHDAINGSTVIACC